MMVAKQNIHWQLQDLLSGFVLIKEQHNVEITGLALDSREVKPGDLFVALAGTQQHGAEFIPAAEKAGAAAILYEAGYELELPKLDLPLISMAGLSEQAGHIAHRFYAEPSKKLKVIGITGTNGKTSSSWFMAQALQQDKQSVGVIGTLGTGLFGDLSPSLNTTPNVFMIHQLLADFLNRGIEYVVMEVSSHALHQYRVSGIEFHSVILLNISRDHLDYHGTMDAYVESKQRLFTDYLSKYQVFNIDDENGRKFAQTITESYAISLENNHQDIAHTIQAENIQQSDQGMMFTVHSPWGEERFSTSLIGRFNLYNLLSVITVLGLSGFSLSEIKQRLVNLTSPPGRMQIIQGTNTPLVIIDYAHTPDALEKLLQTVSELNKDKLLLVFGCGGDRDRGKRSLMGEVASCNSDHVFLTNDNPRGENPMGIIEDIQQGIVSDINVTVELDRSEAIALAIAKADRSDVVVVAGKGHENYQLVGEQKFTFSDQAWVERYLGIKT